ncbi:MAG: hypothetical protein O7C67_15855 [Gammaproteobacteria bacterium]|nr:hypothetical protein [Gammaproteobacteria bacterium]
MTLWSGAERVAIAEEVRNADVPGAHLTTDELPKTVVDAVHRLTTDPSRLTQSWLNQVTNDTFTSGHYVEIISVVVTTLCIDSFRNSLGFDLEPLPEPQGGEPSGYVLRVKG